MVENKEMKSVVPETSNSEASVCLDPAELYLRLLKDVLLRINPPERYKEFPKSRLRNRSAVAASLYPRIQRLLRRWNLSLVSTNINRKQQHSGQSWPAEADSMIGAARMDNIHQCIRTVLHEGVPGDFIETGIWRGGACIFMRGALAAYGDTARNVWAADSFEGLPRPDPKYAADLESTYDFYRYSDTLAVSLEQVKANFEKYGLLDERVKFLKGWFKDTLPTAPIERLAILRLDGDMYESTIQVLEALYPKVSRGGFVIVDDFDISECRKAVGDYRQRQGITDEIVDIDGMGVFWRVGCAI
jgi:O-methyltransferase